MKAMILAAGRGERMRPLTDERPKPLLRVGQHSLIEHHLLRLKAAGFSDIVINVSWLGTLIQNQLGDGSQFGVTIEWSEEPPGALETGGALRQALPLLGNKPFLLVNGDVWTDYPYTKLRGKELLPEDLLHCVMVPNPPQHADGDFGVSTSGRLIAGDNGNPATGRYTYSGIGVYRPALVANQPAGRFPLAPLLKSAIATNQASGELYRGDWRDIGTPQRLQQLQNEFSSEHKNTN